MGMMSKTCTKCSVEKPLEDFDIFNDRSRASGKRVRSHCKVCRREMVKGYDTKNKKAKSVYNKAYREDNREAISEKGKVYRKNNLEKITAYHKSWSNANPGVVSLHRTKRRQGLRNATPNWLTDDHITEIGDFYTLAKDCYLISGEVYEVDHIVPLQGKDICGLHVPWNLQVLPRDINRKKNNKYDLNCTDLT